jgi:acetyl-CoA carboxylase carboxyl transferase subunit alpha
MGVIDEIVAEPLGGAHTDHKRAAELLDARLLPALESLRGQGGPALREDRYRKFRTMGAVARRTS